MTTPDGTDPRLTKLPTVLRELLTAELAAGNSIAEIASCFPAPPAGLYVKLHQLISTRPRAGGEGIVFYDRSSSSYSGEWTDSKRYFFLLEPPHPPPPEVDMDAIRRALAGPSVPVAPPRTDDDGPSYSSQVEERLALAASSAAVLAPGSCLRRFEASMVIDYEKWHDGIGYDLALLREANPAELACIEDLLIGRRAQDWRDIEALAAIGSKRAKDELRRAFGAGNAEIRAAVVTHAPELVADDARSDHLVEAFRTADLYHGLSQALSEAAEFHPPAVLDQIFRSVLSREGGVAVHCAALLLFIHGKAESQFDWAHRPFLLRFNTEDTQVRKAVFRELCEQLGVDPTPYL
jgi:hypothetical protein